MTGQLKVRRSLLTWRRKVQSLFRGHRGPACERRSPLAEDLEQRLCLSAAFDVTGLTALRQQAGYSSIDGSGVGIAILDSGVYAKNPDLKSNVVAFYNAVENAVPASIGASSVNGATDKEGHGTHVSGIAASSNPEIGVAYRAQLIDVKVIPDSGESQIGGDPLLRGLQFVAQYADQFNIKVVNMSLGEADQNGGLNLNSVPNADDISREIQELESLGITVVSAAGNSYANDPQPGESYPAVVSTLSVASTWADTGSGYDFNVVAWGSDYDNYAAYENSAAADRFSATSQRSTLGNLVAAPGVNIYSTWNNSSSDNAGGSLLYNTLSGTSMAAPFVSGVVALMQDAAFTFGGRYLTDTTQIRHILQQTADVIVDSNVSDNGRVALVNGQPVSSRTSDLPETGQTYYRINVQKAIQYVRQLFSGGAISTADLDNTTAAATATPALTGTRNYSNRGTVGTDGLNQVGANDVDLFKVTLDSPGVLTAALSQPSGGSAFAAEVRLFDSSGNQVASVSGSASAYPTLTTGTDTPLAIGTYYVGISSDGNAAYSISDGTGAAGGSTRGDYVVVIGLSNPDPNGVAQGATVVDLTDPNATLSGNVVANEYQGDIGSDPPIGGSSTRTAVHDGDVDMFKVVAPDSGVLTLQTNTTNYGFAAVDSYVRVFDANLNEIAANDDISRFDTDSYVQVNVQVGQTYYVAVTNYANRNFDAHNPYGRVANSTASDRYYDLYLSFDNGDQNGTAFLATSATVGQTMSASIGSDNGHALAGANGGDKDVDFYTLTTSSAGLLDFTITATTNGFSPSLSVWSLTADRTSINRIATTTGSGNHLILPVTARQTLYISVTGKGNEGFNWYSLGSGTGGQTGNYSLASTLRPSGDYAALSDGAIQSGTPQTLTVGSAIYGVLGQDGPLVVAADVDIYRLTVPTTGMYDLRTDTSREGSADTVLRLFDASGTQLDSNDNASDRTTSSLIRTQLVAGQTYYVGISGAGAGATAYNANTGSGAIAGSTGAYGLLVSPATDAPVAADDTYTTAADVPLAIAAPGVLANDTAAANNPLTAALVDAPSHGTVILNSDGSFTYTPAARFNGTDAFTYVTNDGTTDSNVATVQITVTPASDAPVAVDDVYSTPADTTLAISSPGLLGNDTDAGGSELAAIMVDGPADGSVAVNADGSFVYTPNAGFSGADHFTYQANNGLAQSNVAIVTINVAPVSHAPTAARVTVELSPRTATVIDVHPHVSDADGDALTLSLAGLASRGKVTLNRNNTPSDASDDYFVYRPDSDFYGVDAFSYLVSDGHGGAAQATVSLQVDQLGLCSNPTDPRKTDLIVLGSPSRDVIQLTRSGRQGVKVVINGASKGVFSPTARVIVDGGAGDDVITASNLVQPVRLYGNAGNDRLTVTGSRLRNYLFGGDGDDTLRGTSGRDFLSERS